MGRDKAERKKWALMYFRYLQNHFTEPQPENEKYNLFCSNRRVFRNELAILGMRDKMDQLEQIFFSCSQ